MTERKVELPKQTCTLCDGRGAVVRCLARIADMEALLREMREQIGSTNCITFDAYEDWCKRVDSLLAEGL